jgi:uncharacterized membrane protein YeiB
VRFGGVKTSLAAVGRMAFTNYIVQSIIGTLVFFGYGLGLFGKLERPALMLTGPWGPYFSKAIASPHCALLWARHVVRARVLGHHLTQACRRSAA